MSLIVPKNDTRIYKNIILKNDLQVLIIYDPKTIVSAAALSVKIGYYNDLSVNINGIAHFLEHMLFMGTEKYPEVNYFMSFLNKYSGYTNAYTTGDITNYYFDINNEHFEEALDIFGNFFIKPSFDENTISKEINAVNEEYAKNFSSDLFKQNMIIRTLANDHNYNHFACGNKKTLNIKNIRSHVIDFYNNNYSSNLMNLIIYTNIKIEKIEKVIKKIFSLVPNKKLKHDIPIIKYDNTQIYKNLPLKVNILPNNNLDAMYIYWPCPPINSDYKYRPIEYINNLLGHEGRDTLVDFLKKRELCTSINISIFESDKYITMVELMIELTDMGYNNINFILKSLYDYLNKIKTEGITQWQYEEYKKIEHLKFDYSDKIDPVDYVENLATYMCRYELPKIIINNHYWANYTNKAKDIILKYLNYYDISNMILVISSQKIQNQDFQIEKYYKTKYNVSNFNIFELPKTTNFFRLPNKNKYMPPYIKLLACTNKLKYPITLIKNLGMVLWHKQDYTFMTPYVIMNMFIKCNKINTNIKKYASFMLYIDILNDHLSSMASYCIYANSDFYIYVNNNQIGIKINSYNTSIKTILNKIIFNLLNIDINEKKLELIKTNNIKYLSDYANNNPLVKLSDYYLNNFIYNKFYSNKTLIDTIKNITLQDLKKVPKYLKNNCKCKCIIQGNYNENQSLELIDNLELLVNKQFKTITNEKIYPLLKGEEELYITKNPIINDKNSLITTLYEIGKNNDEKIHDWNFKYCKLLIIYNLIKEKFFHQLRSIEQLGYICSCNIVNIGSNKNKLYCLKFIIQTVSKTPQYAHKRIKIFIKSFYDYLQNITNSEFDTCIDNTILHIVKPPDNIHLEIQQNIYNMMYNKDFNIKDTFTKILKKYTKEHLIKFFNNKFINKKLRRIRTLYIYGKNKLHN